MWRMFTHILGLNDCALSEGDSLNQWVSEYCSVRPGVFGDSPLRHPRHAKGGNPPRQPAAKKRHDLYGPVWLYQKSMKCVDRSRVYSLVQSGLSWPPIKHPAQGEDIYTC